MPYRAKDAYRHTHKAATKPLQRLWAKIANYELPRIGEKRAIMAADATVARRVARARKKSKLV
jgi:hypothetical protein